MPCTTSNPNYFTCTLGEAVEIQASGKRSCTIQALLDVQAQDHGSEWAVGFPVPKDGEWGMISLKFDDLRNGSIAAAQALKAFLPCRGSCVALLSSSSIDFLLTWLGLIWSGCSVLLIAPQCEPDAIYKLCSSCNVEVLVHDSGNHDLANAVASASRNALHVKSIPWQSQDDSAGPVWYSSTSDTEYIRPDESDVAYIHHTSGTSGGTPKPISQTHHAAVGVLARLSASHKATFSTTPLYHGGIADCFRAWTSGEFICLFPGAVPITSKNILASLKAAETVHALPTIKYFSSVPFVLQMLAEEPEGIESLRNMDVVGVGGAALPSMTGDMLVQTGINLVSRFGSAECGFLMCSSRDFATDKDWQYLRIPADFTHLSFEKTDTELSELVVKCSWPHMTKSNREDGSFATHDLFQPHPTIPNAWKYHSRSDSQITLVTGKKFDPAPIEEGLCASADVFDCMIFGNGEQQPGMFIFPSRGIDAQAKSAIWELLEAINSKGQSHTRIGESMIVYVQDGRRIPKSSKGTILRGAAEKVFKADIHQAYEQSWGRDFGYEDVGEALSELSIGNVVAEVVGRKIPLDTDLYSFGVNSIMCTQIRERIQRKYLRNQDPLPWNVVYDCGNVQKLVDFVRARHAGILESNDSSGEAVDLVRKYSNLLKRPSISRAQANDKRVVLLTGVTGSLGCEILQVLREDPSVARIVCLVRARQGSSEERVSTALQKRMKSQLSPSDKVDCLPCHLEDADLGLSAECLEELRSSVTHIIHAAWAVNFSLPLRSFELNIAGLKNLIDLTISTASSANIIFCSSIASVLQSKQATIPEAASTSEDSAGSLGYARSKWVAEAICSAAAKSPGMAGKVKVLRIGQLTGDTQHGVWNMTEAWPLMLSTVDAVGCLPRLNEALRWLPMDVAAKAVVELSFAKDGSDEVLFWHLCSTSLTPLWSDLLRWVAEARKKEFEIVEPEIWLKKVEGLDEHPAKSLFGLWKKTLTVKNEQTMEKEQTVIETNKAKAASQTMRHLRPLDEDLVKKLWGWIEEQLRES